MKVLLIGVGAAGNKSALTVLNTNEEISIEDVILVNSTSKDIPAEYTGKRIILSPDDSGCGKERPIAKEFTLTAIQTGKFDIAEDVESYDLIAVVASLEGGTGSGAAPIIAKYCNQVLGKNVQVFGFTGFEEDVRGLQNTVEFFQELDDDIAVQCIRNASFMKQAGSKFKAEQMANRELARRISLIDGSMLNASDQNIDSTDIYKVVNTWGYTTTGYEVVRGPLTDVADFNKICEKMVYEDRGLKNVDPGQERMAVIMNISPVSEDYIDPNFTVLKKAFGNPYECFIHKQYNPDEDEYIAFISAGQRLPLEEVKAIYERYLAESKKVNKVNDTFFSKVNSFVGNAEDNMFNMGRPKQKESIAKGDFIKQFQTKPAPKKEEGKKG